MPIRRRRARALTAAVLAGALSVGTGAPAGAADKLPTPAPDATFQTYTVQNHISQAANRSRSIAEFRGRKVMLWMFSTWCSSCAAAFDALGERQADLARAGLEVIALKNFDNGGYPGPSLPEFVARFGHRLLSAPNWTFGEVPAQMARSYNPRRYPDVYFLIDERGMIQAVNGAPAATMDTITRFAGLD